MPQRDKSLNMKTPLENSINELIKAYSSGNSGNFSAGNISDSIHTFNDLYDARALLFIVLINKFPDQAWRFTQNHDGQSFDGYFGLGLFSRTGQQITYHMPQKYFDMVKHIEHHQINPFYDGHTAADVLYRLIKLSKMQPVTSEFDKNNPVTNPLTQPVTTIPPALPKMDLGVENTFADADAALVKQNQLLSAQKRTLDNDLTKALAKIADMEHRLSTQGMPSQLANLTDSKIDELFHSLALASNNAPVSRSNYKIIFTDEGVLKICRQTVKAHITKWLNTHN